MSDTQSQVTITGCTDTGIRRKHNQDHIGYKQNPGIAVLADGMGGHQAGEVAAHMAVELIVDKLHNLIELKSSAPITDSRLLELVSDSITQSNKEIYEASHADENHKGMGTTVVAAIVEGAYIYAAHVGDSRLYLYREQELRRITKDHSLVQSLIDKGFYTEREARNASIGNVVTRSLGNKPEVEVDTRRIEMEVGDVFLLCSDGLTDMVADWQIAEVINENSMDLDKTVKELVDLANKSGGKDNISVILILVEAIVQTPDVQS